MGTLGCSSLTRAFRAIIRHCIAQDCALTEEVYDTMASGTEELNTLVSKGTNVADCFDEIYEYFRSSQSTTVEKNEEIFARGASEMRAFVAALGAARIRSLFLGVAEPKNTSKPSYYNNRSKYNPSEYSRGTSAKKSTPNTPAKKKSLGFADGDNDVPQSAPVKKEDTVPEDTSTEIPALPKTPGKSARKSSVASRGTARPVALGFADDDTPPLPTPTKPKAAAKADSGDSSMNKDEEYAMSILADFLDPSSTEYDIIPSVRDAILEATRSKKATTEVSRSALDVFRSSDSAVDDLGYGKSEKVNSASKIVAWVLNNAVSK